MHGSRAIRGPSGSGRRRGDAVHASSPPVEASACEWQGEPIRFTVSAGLAARQPTEPLSAPWDRADRALYEAKRAGRNRVVLAT